MKLKIIKEYQILQLLQKKKKKKKGKKKKKEKNNWRNKKTDEEKILTTLESQRKDKQGQYDKLIQPFTDNIQKQSKKENKKKNKSSSKRKSRNPNIIELNENKNISNPIKKNKKYLKERKHYAWFKYVKLKNLKDVKKASGTR